jgi:hypothetical protein
MDEAGLKILQRAQENALRIMFSANRNSSKAALNLLARIEHIKERQLIMQTSFFGFLHNNNDACIPAIRVWWNGIQEKTKKGSLITLARSKQGLSAITPMRNHLSSRLTRQNATTDPIQAITPAIREAVQRKSKLLLSIKPQGIADSLKEMDQKDYRPILSSNYLPFQIRADVIKWLIGNICWHKPCLKCNEQELSRKHGISCSGAELEMQVIFDTEFTNFYETTLPTENGACWIISSPKPGTLTIQVYTTWYQDGLP